MSRYSHSIATPSDDWESRYPKEERPDSAYLMAKSIAGQGIDFADEAGVICALMEHGYRVREIMPKIEQVKLLGWAAKFGVEMR